MCPAAHARSTRPQREIAKPANNVAGRGLANKRKSAAQTKLNGTRNRWIQVPPLSNGSNSCKTDIPGLLDFELNLENGQGRNACLSSRSKMDRQECLSYFQALADSLKHSLNFNVHTNPLRTCPPMAVCSAVDIYSVHANIILSRAAVAPPFCGPKEPYDWGASRDG